MNLKKMIKDKIDNVLYPFFNQLNELNASVKAQKEVIAHLKSKLNTDEPITVLFICSRPEVWGSLETVYQSCVKNEKINPLIIAIPNKKDLPKIRFNHDEYIDEGAYDFFKKKGYNVINGYDFKTREWINVDKYAPDYVFLQTPYDVCRPVHLRSNVLSSYTKVCFVHYAVPFINGFIEVSSSPNAFLRNVDFAFCETEEKQCAVHPRKASKMRCLGFGQHCVERHFDRK